jgi:hypothetical protein
MRRVLARSSLPRDTCATNGTFNSPSLASKGSAVLRRLALGPLGGFGLCVGLLLDCLGECLQHRVDATAGFQALVRKLSENAALKAPPIDTAIPANVPRRERLGAISRSGLGPSGGVKADLRRRYGRRSFDRSESRRSDGPAGPSEPADTEG